MKDLRFTIAWGENALSQYTLQYSPEGWDDNALTVERSSTYYGIFRSFTIKLKFVKDGANILRDLFYNGGNNHSAIVNAPACETRFTVDKLNRITLLYETLFVGTLDFATFNDNENFVEITVIDSGLSNYVKANQDNEYTVNFLTANSFKHPLYANSRIEFIYFSRLLELVFDRLTEGGLTSGKYALDSNALKTLEASSLFRIVLANHSSLKTYRMTIAKTSFKDLMKTIYVLFRLTGSIENREGKDTFVLYPLSTVFSNDVIMTAGNVTNFRLSVANDYIYNKLLIGHETQEYGDATQDSLKEFNVTSEYKISNIPYNNDLELVTAFRADTTGIKAAMQDIRSMPDEEEMFICVIQRYFNTQTNTFDWEFEPGFVKQSEQTTTCYNARISPRRLVGYHSSFLASIRYGANPGSLEFVTTGLYNYSLLTRYVNSTIPPANPDFVEESSNYTLPDARQFYPLYIEFDTDLPPDMVSKLQSKPYGRVEFTYNGNLFSGYLISVSLRLFGRCSAKMKLLSTATNDLKKLIHG